MATIFCDSFDLYASINDMLTTAGGPWTSNGNGSLGTITQFSTGQYYTYSTNGSATFTSATNETTIYGSIRLKPNTTGSITNYGYISFNDAGTAQCTIRWNTDGSVNLYGGGPSGTLLQSFASIYTSSVWNSFQFKVVIDNAAGSIELRVNGSGTNAITKTSVNTRAGTTNAYANGFTMGNSGTNVNFDDFYLNNTSGNNPVSWPGDIRAIQQVPSAVTSSTFSRVQGTTSQVVYANGGANTFNANTAVYGQFTMTASFVVNSVSFLMNSNLTGNVKFAIFDNTGTGGTPGAIMATSNAVNNPTTSGSTATFISPPTLAAGTYYLGVDQDANASFRYWGSATGYTNALSYSSFPTANPGSLSVTGLFPYTTLNFASSNQSCISEKTQDGDTSYIYSGTVQEDTYTMSQISTQYGVVAVQYAVMWRKDDAGTRTARISTAANGSSDTALITNSALTTSYLWQFATFEKDPTGAYWTPVTVNGQTLGVAVTV